MRTRHPRTQARRSTLAAGSAAHTRVADLAAPQSAGAAETSPMGFGDHGYTNLRGNDLGGAATEVSRVDVFTT
jgi:pectate lyase